MKIIIVHNKYQRPGGEDVVFEQETRLLKENGHEVITYVRSNWEVESYPGVRRLTLVRKTIWSDDTLREFGQLLRDEKPDLVHIHNTFIMISPSIYSACYQAGVPVVQTLHNYRLYCPAGTFFRDGGICEDCVEHSLWRSVAHGCYRGSRAATAAVALMLSFHRMRDTWTNQVERYIALSEFSRATYVRAGLSRDKISVKPNFVYPDPGASTDTGDYALFTGRLSPEKRVSTILNSWSTLDNTIPLLIIGGGPEGVPLQAEAERRGLSAIQFKGQLPRNEAIAFLRRARFLIFSSEWYENFPVTIAESFACGVPVICSRLGAMREIVEDGRTGLHFTAGDPNDLAAKVEWAWTHPKQMQEMGREARREFEMKYTAARNYELLIDIYRRAVYTKAVQPETTPGALMASRLKS